MTSTHDTLNRGGAGAGAGAGRLTLISLTKGTLTEVTSTMAQTVPTTIRPTNTRIVRRHFTSWFTPLSMVPRCHKSVTKAFLGT